LRLFSGPGKAAVGEGFMGDAHVLLFDGGEKAHPTKPGEVVRVWRLMVQERDPSWRPQARQADRIGEVRSRPEPTSRSAGTAAPNAPDKPSARPQERGDGWRGSPLNRRPANGAKRAPAAGQEAFFDDSLEDIGR
jgi:hypothetical protein